MARGRCGEERSDGEGNREGRGGTGRRSWGQGRDRGVVAAKATGQPWPKEGIGGRRRRGEKTMVEMSKTVKIQRDNEKCGK